MERAAKERLIGAVVLVTAAWLLIPVFLDQRPARDEALVTRDLALPGREEAADGAPALRRETIDLSVSTQPERNGNDTAPPIAALPVPNAAEVTEELVQPVATASPDDETGAVPASVEQERQPANAVQDEAVAETPTQEAPQQVVEEAPAPAEPSPTAPAPASDGQLWAVQLGSFSDEANAQRLAAKYRAEGLSAFVSQVQSSGRTLHRVRIGPQASRAQSEAVVARLKAQGQTAGVVAHP